MAVDKNDMNELRRIATNTYDSDKAWANRLMKGITDLQNKVVSLTNENTRLKEQLEAKS